jgi:hypothetical protein
MMAGSAATGTVTYCTYNGKNQLTNAAMPRGNITQYRVFGYNYSDLASESTPKAAHAVFGETSGQYCRPTGTGAVRSRGSQWRTA